MDGPDKGASTGQVEMRVWCVCENKMRPNEDHKSFRPSKRGGGRKGFVLIYQVVHINIWWYDHSWGGALEIYLTFNRWPRINSSISKHLNPLHPIIMVDNSLKRTSNVLHIASVACTAMYTHILSAVIYHTLYTITLLFSVQYVSCLSMMPIQIFVHMLA